MTFCSTAGQTSCSARFAARNHHLMASEGAGSQNFLPFTVGLVWSQPPVSTPCCQVEPTLTTGVLLEEWRGWGYPVHSFLRGAWTLLALPHQPPWVEGHCNDGHVKQDTRRRQAPCRRRAGGGVGGFRDRGAKEGAWGEQTGLSPGTLRAALDGLTSTLVQPTSARQTSAPRD